MSGGGRRDGTEGEVRSGLREVIISAGRRVYSRRRGWLGVGVSFGVVNGGQGIGLVGEGADHVRAHENGVGVLAGGGDKNISTLANA